jgi:BirA family transcriptional regulator, biotin operon repressor / biotin---[acetyl-CoA-carboxylase] ligase
LTPVWLHQLDSCPSTNTWAIEHAETLIHGDVVFTTNQTAGRGQHGRLWQSPDGVLTASFVLDRFPVDRLPGLSLVVGLATIHAVESLLPGLAGELKLKWPNDIWLDDRKLGGILCESSIRGMAIFTRVIVGVGLNCQVDLANLSDPAMSLDRALIQRGIVVDFPGSLAFLAAMRQCLVHFTQAQGLLAAFESMLRSRDLLCGRTVTLEISSDDRLIGKAIGINSQGQLQVQMGDGTVRSLYSGRIIDMSEPEKT